MFAFILVFWVVSLNSVYQTGKVVVYTYLALVYMNITCESAENQALRLLASLYMFLHITARQNPVLLDNTFGDAAVF